MEVKKLNKHDEEIIFKTIKKTNIVMLRGIIAPDLKNSTNLRSSPLASEFLTDCLLLMPLKKELWRVG